MCYGFAPVLSGLNLRSEFFKVMALCPEVYRVSLLKYKEIMFLEVTFCGDEV